MGLEEHGISRAGQNDNTQPPTPGPSEAVQTPVDPLDQALTGPDDRATYDPLEEALLAPAGPDESAQIRPPAAPEAHRHARGWRSLHRRRTRPHPHTRGPNRFLSIIANILMALGVFLILQTGLVQAFSIPTGSMETTIIPGDCLLAEKVSLGARTPQWVGIPGTNFGLHLPALKLPGLRQVRRGDIVVIEVPCDKQIPYVKRVVGLPGDTIQVRDKQLFVNGKAAREPAAVVHEDHGTFPPGMAQDGISPRLGNRDNFGPCVVPAGSVFLMGDNRDFSMDSRYFGPVPVRNIIGRARWIAVSFDRDPHMPLWERLRVGRIGAPLT